MPLSELKEKLYKKDQDKSIIRHEQSEFDPKNKEVSPANVKFDANDAWEERKAFLADEGEKKIVKRGLFWLFVVLGLIGLMVALYGLRQASFDEGQVAINITGPDQARSGELVSYEINYVNKNWGSLDEVVLRINHPESFKPEDSQNYKEESPTISVVNLGKVGGKSSGKIIYSGKAYSPKGTLIYLKTEMDYSPMAFSSSFNIKSQVGVNVTSTPIKLELFAPMAVASGNSLDYQINYKNEGAEPFENIRIKVDLPDSFVFSGSDPGASEGNNVWHIGQLPAGGSGRILISGSLSGEKNTYKNAEAHLGIMNQGQFVSYNDEKVSTRIVDSPLSIWQTVNDEAILNVNPGEELSFKIYYKNDGDLRLKNVIIKENLNSLVLDYATLEMGGGAFIEESKTIEWKASDHPELALLSPGQSGFVEFFVKVKDIIPVKTVSDKNFMISSLAKIDSPDIPTPIEMNKVIASNRKDLKLNTKLIMTVGGFYNDAVIPNSGPIPPKVGQETTYTIHLKAGNVSNPVSGAKAEIVIPTGIIFTGKIYPENSKLTFNERTNSLVWDIGDMQVGEGIISPYREAVFQVKLKPSPDQLRKVPSIVKSVKFSGKDNFTGQELVVDAGGKDIMLLEDTSITGGSWEVTE